MVVGVPGLAGVNSFKDLELRVNKSESDCKFYIQEADYYYSAPTIQWCI